MVAGISTSCGGRAPEHSATQRRYREGRAYQTGGWLSQWNGNDTEPIAQAVELLGIDRIDGKASIQQDIDDGSVRHLGRDGNNTYIACDRHNPVTQLCQTGATMHKIAFFDDVTLSIENASLVLLGSPVDTAKPKDLSSLMMHLL